MLTSAEAIYGTEDNDAVGFEGSLSWDTSLKLPLPTSYTVPENCCVKCGVTASDVRLLFWPIETSVKNTSGTTEATSTPYGVVSDGFTLLVDILGLCTAV